MEPVPLSQPSEATARSRSPPTPSNFSDKENPRSANKRTTAQMAPSSQSAKRRRLTDRASNIQSRMPPSSQRHDNTRYYDPDQDEDERRRTRKQYRDLVVDFNDSRAEFMRSGNNGIYETVSKANVLYENVKQTSDATLDSRLLVNAADLSHRKAAQLALGDSSAGIDVDEFVTKCISFMRRGPDSSEAMPSSTQNRRRHRRSQREADSDDEDGAAGDAMNWDWLGRAACLPHNARPSVSGWLLGPLSVQKRTRQITQRTRAERFDATQAVRPQELQQEDLGQQENSNLTVICTRVNNLLHEASGKAEDEVNKELDTVANPTEKMIQDIMDKHGISTDGGLNLFRFCINPQSFGQSVENLFYVSFLVRDGTVGVGTDSRGIPNLIPSVPYAPSEAQKKQIQKRQAVFSLDFDTWRELIKVFKISESIIPHREEQEEETGRTWHG
ncbi:hypothetical protein PENDEC_c015G00559 [Penicillium decumbens]|uniref:Non-structural maintenance of chromosomes element 4 n=1 Tax=Penicillium decumbens TaxID=69771 RepID=A0A1V6P8W7_PENDC|nr:hypothetical protein PENDEC_c015G00559 [Penicillium decumbens]